MSVKKIAQLANKFYAYLDNGEIRKASPNEISVYLASLAPGEKNGGILEAVRLNEATGNAEYRYAHKDESGEVSYKIYAKKVLADLQKEPVDSIQDEKKSKTNKTNVPRDESKAKPETDFSRPDGVDNPTKVREEGYGPGTDADADRHTDVVPRSRKDSGLSGSEKTSFDDIGKVSSGSEDSYVQDFTESKTPAPSGSEENHAVAAGSEDGLQKTAGSLNIQFGSDDLMNVLNLVNKSANINQLASDDEDGDDKNPFPFNKGKDTDDDKEEENDSKNKDEAKDEEKDEKSDDKKEASVNKDVAMKLSEAKSQLGEMKENLVQAKAEINKYRMREARMAKAIEYVLNLHQLNPAKYAEAGTFVKKVAETVKKMNVEAIDNAIEETRFAATAIAEAARTARVAESSTEEAELQSALIIPRDAEQGFTTAGNKDNLAKILMDSTRLGKMMNDFDEYTPHEKRDRFFE